MITVEIEGKEYPVAFGRNAYVEYEEIVGQSILNGKFELSYKVLRALTFVGLKWGRYNPSKGIEPKAPFTLLQAGEMVDIGDGGPSAKILKEFLESLPKAKNAEGAEGAPN